MSGADAVRSLWELFEARRWDDARELLHDDFVAEWPHSLERMRGPDAFIDLNRNYPEGWSIRVDRVIDAGDAVVSEITVTQGGDAFRTASVFDLRDGKLWRAREYWVEEGSETHPERERWTESMERTADGTDRPV
jgi:ketosteroid isomerase-like protein